MPVMCFERTFARRQRHADELKSLFKPECHLVLTHRAEVAKSRVLAARQLEEARSRERCEQDPTKRKELAKEVELANIRFEETVATSIAASSGISIDGRDIAEKCQFPSNFNSDQ